MKTMVILIRNTAGVRCREVVRFTEGPLWGPVPANLEGLRGMSPFLSRRLRPPDPMALDQELPVAGGVLGVSSQRGRRRCS